MELLPSFIKAPRSARYLNDFMPDGLPTNCLFDKVTTGCGGTYVALMCAKPYIIAVPTKALVKDKVENPIYAAKGLIGISEDYPLRQEVQYFSSDKLIVTYKSLPELCDRLDISRYNLLIDEAHMLTNMTTYARKELRWILENFRFFKSYCFMSATIPRSSHLLPEIASLNRVYIDWPKVQAVNFECYLTTNTVNTVLQIIYEHYVQKRPGTPYFFYNSVTGICSILKKLHAKPEYEIMSNVVCAVNDTNKKALAKVKKEIGTPNTEADVHFITATAFEGVDFDNEDGVTYIVSDKDYTNTKYSIETTIPQIVGRLRNSKYNSTVTILYNKHNQVLALTPREFEVHLDTKEASAKTQIQVYKENLALIPKPGHAEVAESILRNVFDNPFVEIEDKAKSFEDLIVEYDIQNGKFPSVSFYPYARSLLQQTYDLFHEERYIRGDGKALGDPLSIGKLKGDAPDLSEEAATIFASKPPTLKEICSVYEKDKAECQDRFPEWFQIIDALGMETVRKNSFRKGSLKKTYEALITVKSAPIEIRIAKAFKVGEKYSSKEVKDTLTRLGIPKAKAVFIKRWFEVKEVQVFKERGYRIIRKL